MTRQNEEATSFGRCSTLTWLASCRLRRSCCAAVAAHIGPVRGRRALVVHLQVLLRTWTRVAKDRVRREQLARLFRLAAVFGFRRLVRTGFRG